NSHVIPFCRQFIKPGAFKQKTARAVTWEMLDHPPYSPDLASSDSHLFLKLKEFLGDKRFGSDEELENVVTTWLNELAAEARGQIRQMFKCRR
ncbi:hypothetical protein AVEN_148623-1, partial [Araneus ventricosus]